MDGSVGGTVNVGHHASPSHRNLRQVRSTPARPQIGIQDRDNPGQGQSQGQRSSEFVAPLVWAIWNRTPALLGRTSRCAALTAIRGPVTLSEPLAGTQAEQRSGIIIYDHNSRAGIGSQGPNPLPEC
jgi:hypothetical protein